MKEVILYGKPSYPYQIIRDSLHSSIQKAGLNIVIREIQDISTFIDLKLENIPAVQYQNEIRNLKSPDIGCFIKEINRWILSREAYGVMPKFFVPYDYSNIAQNALAYAKSYSHEINAVITVIKVSNVFCNQQANPKIFSKNLIKQDRLVFKNHIKNLNQSWFGAMNETLPLQSDYLEGNAVEQLKKLPELTTEDLVILGYELDRESDCRDNLPQKLLEHSKFSMLLVPPKVEYSTIRRIGVYAQSFDFNKKEINKILQYTQQLKPEIHVFFDKECTSINENTLRHWRKIIGLNNLHLYKHNSLADSRLIDSFCVNNDIDLFIFNKRNKKDCTCKMPHGIPSLFLTT